jgi:uncharacterized Tic20 family protein
LGERPSHAIEHALGGAEAEMPIAYGGNARALSHCWRGTMSVPEIHVGPDERNWSVAVHLSAFAALFIPLGHLLGPLAIWLIKRREMPMLDRHGKEALNFQITVTLASFVCGLLFMVGIGLVLLFALLVADAVLIIMAAVKTSRGEAFRYPFTLRLFT